MLKLQPSTCLVWFFDPEKPLRGNVLSVSSSYLLLELLDFDAEQGRVLYEQLCEYEFYRDRPDPAEENEKCDYTRLDITLVTAEKPLIDELVRRETLTLAEITDAPVWTLQVALKECHRRVDGVTSYVAPHACGVLFALDRSPEHDWMYLKLHRMT